MSVEETKATIRNGIQAAGQAIEGLEQLDGDTGDMIDLARYTTHDSRHTHVTTGLARITHASREIEIVHRRLSNSIDAARDYLKVLG